MLRLTWGKIPNDIQPFGSGSEVGIGKRVTVCHWEIGPGHFEDNNPHLGITGRDLCGGKIARGDIVVIPETEVDRLATRKEFPHLGRKNAEVGTRIGSGLWPRMSS